MQLLLFLLLLLTSCNSTSVTSRNSTSHLSTSLTGNPIDDCLSTSSSLFHLASCAVGFGRGANGGLNGQIYTVTDSSDSDPVTPKPGTLRHAAIQEGPVWIVFSASMTIILSQELLVNSQKTIDGRNAEIHIAHGACITLQYVSHVIIHNIHIHDCISTGNANVRSSPTHYGFRTMADGDGISLYSATDVWIDHCTLSRCADGLIDAIMGSTRITISNNYFSHHNEVMLLGHSDDYLPDSQMQVTIAFNKFGEELVQRMPRIRRGYVHIVNNDYTEWKMYAIGGSGGPTINSQGNRFTAPSDPRLKEVTKRDTDEKDWSSWNWRTDGDDMVNGAFFVPSGSGPMLESKYVVDTEAKTVSMIDQITMNAGAYGGSRDDGGGGGGGGGGGDDSSGGMTYSITAPTTVPMLYRIVMIVLMSFRLFYLQPL